MDDKRIPWSDDNSYGTDDVSGLIGSGVGYSPWQVPQHTPAKRHSPSVSTRDDTPDIQIIEATPDAENGQMELIAKMAANTLCSHYPSHLWAIGWAPGMTLVIKNMSISDGRYGYTVDAAKAATTSELEHAIVIGGGELLERCGVARGAWNGEMMHLQDKA